MTGLDADSYLSDSGCVPVGPCPRCEREVVAYPADDGSPAAGAGEPGMRGERYACPATRSDYAGSVLCLARTAEPDTSSFDAPEIVFRMKKHHHAGLIVRSPRPGRVRELLEQYSTQFSEKFLATMPPPPKPTA